MKQHIAYVSLVVPNYDAAIAYYVDVLGFTLVRDDPRGDGKRWVVVAPPGAQECGLVLAQAKNPTETAAIGHQAGGRVFLFLHTDDFARDHQALTARGVRFCEKPRVEPYGTVAVFEDKFGNRWDLLQLTPSAASGAGPDPHPGHRSR